MQEDTPPLAGHSMRSVAEAGRSQMIAAVGIVSLSATGTQRADAAATMIGKSAAAGMTGGTVEIGRKTSTGTAAGTMIVMSAVVDSQKTAADISRTATAADSKTTGVQAANHAWMNQLASVADGILALPLLLQAVANLQLQQLAQQEQQLGVGLPH